MPSLCSPEGECYKPHSQVLILPRGAEDYFDFHRSESGHQDNNDDEPADVHDVDFDDKFWGFIDPSKILFMTSSTSLSTLR